MIKRTLLTGLFYLSIVFVFLYIVGCFIQWEIVYIPPISEWTNEGRTTLFFSYLITCAIAFMVEVDIRDKKKRLAEELARDLKRDMNK